MRVFQTGLRRIAARLGGAYNAWASGGRNSALPAISFFVNIHSGGEVLELADSLDLGSSAARRGGSNPPFPTIGPCRVRISLAAELRLRLDLASSL